MISTATSDAAFEQEALAQAFLGGNSCIKHPAVGTVQNYKTDQEIFAEGANADCFYKVASGTVRVCKFLADGRRQIDGFYMAGEIFGFEPNRIHRFSAEAVNSCTVVAYRRNRINLFSTSDVGLSQALLAYAIRGITRCQEHSLILGRRSAAEKLVAFLIDLAEQSGDREAIAIPMSRQDIADYLGLTIETVSRTFSQLERDRLISLQGARQVQFRDRQALQDMRS